METGLISERSRGPSPPGGGGLLSTSDKAEPSSLFLLGPPWKSGPVAARGGTRDKADNHSFRSCPDYSRKPAVTAMLRGHFQGKTGRLFFFVFSVLKPLDQDRRLIPGIACGGTSDFACGPSNRELFLRLRNLPGGSSVSTTSRRNALPRRFVSSLERRGKRKEVDQ